MKVLIIDDSLAHQIVADILGVLEKYGKSVSVAIADEAKIAEPPAPFGLLICGTEGGVVAALARSLVSEGTDAAPIPAQAIAAGALIMSSMPDLGRLEDMVKSVELRMNEEKFAIRDLRMRGRKIERIRRSAVRRMMASNAPQKAHMTRRVW
jgi:hypothetical protein